MTSATSMWTGAWVAERYGVRLTSNPGQARPVDGLVGLALRRNPRRAHLLVSTVLGKHVPADPRVVIGAGMELGRLVGGCLDEPAGLVLGFAETATGLGHLVAEALSAPYLHSTRRSVATARPLAGFEEEHSHASSHQLLPDDPTLLSRAGALVLVDDELSTGRTAMNTITALQAIAPRSTYVIAALIDLRTDEARTALDDFADRVGVSVTVVSLGAGTLTWPDGFVAAAARAVAEPDAEPSAAGDRTLGDVLEHRGLWPAGVREGGRHGFTNDDVSAAKRAAQLVADGVGRQLLGREVLVLGSEELMYAPTLIAERLVAKAGHVRVSSTTRSPVFAHDEPGYPIRNAISFMSHDHPADGAGLRYAYNLRRHRGDGGFSDTGFSDTGFSDIVLVVDTDGDTPALAAGLVAALRPLAGRVHVVVLPAHRPLPEPLRGPAFGSYPAADVAWLLTDLSAVTLEAPTEEREEAVQAGGAHYAESLPIEYQPDAEYRELFARALEDSAGRIAHAVGIVTELVLAERGRGIALASLARAGTPIGVLMRRWARFAHGLELAHYAVSIVRGRGIDTVALAYLAAQHRPSDVVFVDGWTGKGAIARELTAAIAQANVELGTFFDPALAVLADPGSCVETFGTREDFLIPSACLNSTVSGLVSRTVLNEQVLAPGQFHGAKFYAELAGDDVSAQFLDAVTARFPDVAERVATEWPVARCAERRPTWAGWDQAERISVDYGIGDVTLVKPGVGETTRVLLRRVPWAVLVRPGDAGELDHVRLLAAQRGVPVHEVEGLTYRCVGLIHPRFSRGASGADGRSAAPDGDS